MDAQRDASALRAPFPYFGGKTGIATLIWDAFGEIKQYVEPFCGSAAVLLACRRPAQLEVVGDYNRHIANFWRATKCQPDEVWRWSDYPVSHIDLAARHRWLEEPARALALDEALSDPEWPGDAQAAGWWCWGQCAWIGSGWCNGRSAREDSARLGCGPGAPGTRTDSDAGNAGQGLQAHGKIPHASDAGQELQAHGQIPHAGNAGRGLQAHGQIPHASSAGQENLSPWQDKSRAWLCRLSRRLERVRLVHGDWTRCLNNHYGGAATAFFFDPPYVGYEALYHRPRPVAIEVAEWCAANAGKRIALCGHVGDYDLPGWEVAQWDRGRLTYSGRGTTAAEAVWFSPPCNRLPPVLARDHG